MKMHFIVYLIGILSALTIVKCNVENVGNNEINSSEDDDQDDDEILNGINLSHDDGKINEAVPRSLELRRKKCGKTKQACKDAGGYCHARAKEDNCDGELLKGKKYCAKNKKCGCCVAKEKPLCVPVACSYNQTAGICARDKPEGYILRGSQECDVSTGCNCYTPEQLSCATRDGGPCIAQEYRRKYAENGNPCVCQLRNNVLIKGECSKLPGQDIEVCNNALGDLVSCGGICWFQTMPHFKDHVCTICNTPLATQEWCKDRFGDTKNVNHVFYTDYTWGKIDYAVNQYGQVQQICIIPEYVQAWYCARDAVKGWKCSNIQSCTGGGTMRGKKPGHFMLTSLHCQHHLTL